MSEIQPRTGGARSRAVVVTTAWSAGTEAYPVRRVAAALAVEAEVTVVVAEGHRGVVTEYADGPFSVIKVPSQVPDLHRADLLLKALTAGGHRTGAGARGAGARGAGAGGAGARGAGARGAGAGEAGSGGAGSGGAGSGGAGAIPAPLRAEVRRLAGSTSGTERVLASTAPDAVLVAGHRHELATMPVKKITGASRSVLLPLAVDDVALGLSVADRVGDGWDAMAATNAFEAELLGRSLAIGPDAPAVHDLGLCLEPPLSLVTPDLAAWIGDEAWLVVLDDPSRPGRETSFAPVDYLAMRYPTLTMVVVGPGTTTVLRGRRRRVEACLDRGSLWTLMAGAVATLDLRPSQGLAREALESLMLSTPVVVAADSGAARRCAQDGNGGLWYRDAPELAACIARMLDRKISDVLGAQGRRWAVRVHGDQDAFVQATCRALFG